MSSPEIEEVVWNHLVAAYSSASSARLVAHPRNVISAAYLAIDNYLSALLRQHHINPTKNHWRKIELAFHHLGDELTSNGLSETILRHHLELWQEARYEEGNIDTQDALECVRLLGALERLVNLQIVGESESTFDDLLDLEYRIREAVILMPGSVYENQIGDLVEARQMEIEIYAETHPGVSKLLGKLTAPYTGTEIDVLAGDPTTREIVQGDEYVARMITDVFNDFLDLINVLRNKREAAGVDPNYVTDFLFSIHLGHQGYTIEERGEFWRELVREGREMFPPETGDN